MPEERLRKSHKQNQHIQLVSPVMDKIPTHIMENARCHRCGGLPFKTTNPAGLQQYFDKVSSRLFDPEALAKTSKLGKLVAQLTYALKVETNKLKLTVCTCEKPDQWPVVRKDQYKGKTVMICGSGPSLDKVRKWIKRYKPDHVWGCNDALNWLTEKGYKVTHGVGIDQSPALYRDCWVDPPDVPFFLASSVDPKLIEHLLSKGRNRITFFHSWIGFAGEYYMYGQLWPHVHISGEGLNVVNRSICTAEWAGYNKIYVAGADCAFGGTPGKDTFHVHGDMAEGVILDGIVDGRRWRTKPDMLVSAKSLVQTKRRMGSRLELLGDTLPRALQHKDDVYLDRCIRYAKDDERKAVSSEVEVRKYAPKVGGTAILEAMAQSSVSAVMGA